jgi:signal peptidase II
MLLAIAALVLLTDQVSKAWVRSALGGGGTIPVIGNVVRLTYTGNTGAAFGMLPGNRVMFIIVSLIVLTGIGAYLWRYRPTRTWTVVALGLVAGGASGNLIDRAVFGSVTDFVQIPLDFPVFNVADSGIVVGVAMLVWWLLFGPAPAEAPGEDVAADTTDGEQ